MRCIPFTIIIVRSSMSTQWLLHLGRLWNMHTMDKSRCGIYILWTSHVVEYTYYGQVTFSAYRIISQWKNYASRIIANWWTLNKCYLFPETKKHITLSVWKNWIHMYLQWFSLSVFHIKFLFIWKLTYIHWCNNFLYPLQVYGIMSKLKYK